MRKVLIDCGLGANTITKISNGGDILTLNFARIADYLDCSIDFLLGRTEHPRIDAMNIPSGFDTFAKSEITPNEDEAILIKAFRSADAQGRFNIIQVCMNEKRERETMIAG